MRFEVTNEAELIALHRALFEAKLGNDPIDTDIPGSPILITLHERIIEALIDGVPPKRKHWDEWRVAERHPQRLEIVRDRVCGASHWKSLSAEERRQLVERFLSPLIATDQSVQEIVEFGNKHHDIHAA